MSKRQKIAVIVWVVWFVFIAISDLNAVPGYLILSSIIFGIYYFSKKSKSKKAAKLEEENTRLQQALQEIDRALPTISPEKVILKKNEVAHFSCPAELYELKTTGYTAGTKSVRVRVMKGVSVGFGGTKSKAQKEFIAVSSGEFVVTNNRAVFGGDNKSFDLLFNKLTSYDHLDDSITFHVGTQSHTLIMDKITAAVSVKILDKLLR